MTVLDDARAVLGTGPVCDFCLGRCFADRSSGLNVEERGHALRVTCAIAADEPFAPVKPADCWVCSGASIVDVDAWTEQVSDALADVEFETFQIGTRPPERVVENERLLRQRAGLAPNSGVTFNAVVNREVGERLARLTGATVDRERPDVVPVLDMVDGGVEVRINPVYLYGRYRKLEPGVSQRVRRCPVCEGTGTVAVDDATRSCDNCGGSGRLPSVEELIAWPVSEAMAASEVTFHTAGREGTDVLMLGTGRPFVLEIKEPRRRGTAAAELAAAVNEAADGAVTVDDVTPVTSTMVSHIGQQPFRQRYRLTVTFADPVPEATFQEAVDNLDGSTVRRHLRIEELAEGRRPHEVVRTLTTVTGDWLDDRTATVAFEVEAGIEPESIATGADGGTEPSLSTLVGTDVDVTEVAIVEVEGREQPFDATAYHLG